MNGDDLFELLGLEAESVLAAAAATEDYAENVAGRIVGESRREDSGVFVASAYTVAGSLWSLVQPERGAMLFERAASEYAESGSPWATVLAICGSPRTNSRAEEWDPERSLLEHPQPEALLLSYLWPVAAGRESDGEELSRLLDLANRTAEEAPALPLGRMRIPLARYLDVGRAIFGLRQNLDIGAGSQERLLSAITAFLARAGEATSAARADRYHWTRFRSGLLPLEPEAAAVSALASMTWRTLLANTSASLLESDYEPLISHRCSSLTV
jgi:hypothetical protein